MAGENSTGAAPRQRRRMLFGTLIIAGLVAVALLIFFLDDLIAGLRREYVVYAVVPGAAGLADGSPVWLDGRPSGEVTAVGVLPVGSDTVPRVVLQVELPVSVRTHVRVDSDVRLTSVNLMSERAVDISSGSATAAVLAPGDTLHASGQLSALELAARASALRQDLAVALTEMRAHAPAIRARLAQMERAFDRLGSVTAEAQRIGTQLENNPGMQMLRDPAFAATVDSARLHAREFGSLLTTLRARTTAAGEVHAALERLQLRSDSLRVQLAAAARALDNPNGTFARMQQDSALVHAIAAARAELDSLIADVRRNPLRYVF